jgi:hypothetical protein
MGQKEGHWFAPQLCMVMTPKIKSVWKFIRVGKTVNGGKSARRQGQQAPILTAGVRAIANTILQANLLSQFEQQRGHCNQSCNGGIPVRDAGKVLN